MAKAPFRNELGDRIQRSICPDCWSDWLEHQTLLINHHGLDVRDPQDRSFLYEQIEKVLLEGKRGEEIDTSLRGEIDW